MSSPCHRASLEGRFLTEDDIAGLHVLYGSYQSEGLALSNATPSPGDKVEITLDFPGAGHRPYSLLVSPRSGGTVPLRYANPSDSRILPIDPELLGTHTSQHLFQRFQGFLDARGQARATLTIPNDDRYVGVELSLTALTLNRAHLNGIQDVGIPLTLRISARDANVRTTRMPRRRVPPAPGGATRKR